MITKACRFTAARMCELHPLFNCRVPGLVDTTPAAKLHSSVTHRNRRRLVGAAAIGAAGAAAYYAYRWCASRSMLTVQQWENYDNVQRGPVSSSS